MNNKEQVIKVVLTPAGSSWSAEREYERLDYISNGKEVWVSIKVDAADIAELKEGVKDYYVGEDAYDVAKAGGYTGTRDEWVAQIQKVSMVDIGFDEEKGAIVIRS